MPLRLIQILTDPGQEKVLDMAMRHDEVIDGWKEQCFGAPLPLPEGADVGQPREKSKLPGSIPGGESAEDSGLDVKALAGQALDKLAALSGGGQGKHKKQQESDSESSAPYSAQNRLVYYFLVDAEDSQPVIDRVNSVLEYRDNSRIIVLPVDASLPKQDESKPKKEKGSRSGFKGISREELYEDIARGAALDGHYLLMVIFSTLAAAIGLIEDNVAVVIGAMVIAPLLGPNLALAFGTATGDVTLMGRAVKCGLAGLGLSIVVAMVIGYCWPSDFESYEILSRTRVNYEAIALALVSGAAAVLSLTRGASSVLVGVMVAVALLPPGAVFGMMLASNNMKEAMGAGILLAVNVVCVNLSAKLVFLFKGVRPRKWHEKQSARRSMMWYIFFWVVTLGVLSFAISLHGKLFEQAPLESILEEE